MSDDKKTIDFKKAKLGLFKNNKNDKNQKVSNKEAVVSPINKASQPLRNQDKKPNAKVLSNLEAIRRQRDDDLKEIKMLRRRLESEEYLARVLEIAQDVYVKSQPHLMTNEEERLAMAESAIQAGQAFYKMAKEFTEYVAMEDFIHDVMEEEQTTKK